MSGVTGRGQRSIKKESVAESLTGSTGFISVRALHQASAGDRVIDLQALVLPDGVTRPNPSVITQINLQKAPDNVRLEPSNGNALQSLDWSISGASTIALDQPALDGQVFEITIENVARNGISLVDARPLARTFVLPAGQTDVNIGPYDFASNLSEQVGAVEVKVDGQQILRSINNDPTQAGDYTELNSVIRLNVADPTRDRNVVVTSIGALVETPSDSQLALIDALQGQVEAQREVLEAVSGQAIAQGAPTRIDLGAFGDRVFTAEQTIALINSILNTPLQAQTAKFDTRNGFGSTNGAIPNWTNTSFTSGGGLFTAVQSDAAFGCSFTILKRCMFTLSFTAQFTGSGEEFGVARNAVASQIGGIGAFSAAPPEVRLVLDHSNSGRTQTCTVMIEANPGDVLRPACNNPITNLGTADDWSCVASAIALDKVV